MVEQLTICTVSFKNKRHVDLNLDLTALLNPVSRPQWIIVENSPAGTPEVFSTAGDDCTVIDGVPFKPEHPRPASEHHAQALHKAFSVVNTRFVVILDPDFYIVLPNWIQSIPEYMQEKGLAILGVPWHPRWYSKFRDFPAMHCMFIDLSQFEADELNFSPGSYVRKKKKPQDINVEESTKSVSRLRHIFHSVITDPTQRERYYQRFVAPLKSVKRVIVVNVRGRSKINKTPDTGYEFYRRTRTKNVNFEYIPVVFYQHEYPLRPRFINRLVDLVVPEKNNFRPLHKGYYVKRGFKAAGLPDTTQYACEEFMWQGKPFGFHVRSVPRTIKQNPLSIEQLSEIIENITAKLDLPTSQP